MIDRFYCNVPYDICLCDVGCKNKECTKNLNTEYVKDYMSRRKDELFNICMTWQCSSYVGGNNMANEAVNDVVNRPKHYVKKYNGAEYECKDTISIITSDENGSRAFNLGNAIKYLWRYKSKNGIEDLRKAIKNIELLIESVEEE